MVIDARSSKRVGIKKLARVTSNESLADILPVEARELLLGPILAHFNAVHNMLYFLLPKTGGVFALRLGKEKVLPELVGRVPEGNANARGIMGTYNSDKELHSLYLYDRVGVYKVNFKAWSVRKKHGEKLSEVSVACNGHRRTSSTLRLSCGISILD